MQGGSGVTDPRVTGLSRNDGDLAAAGAREEEAGYLCGVIVGMDFHEL